MRRLRRRRHLIGCVATAVLLTAASTCASESGSGEPTWSHEWQLFGYDDYESPWSGLATQDDRPLRPGELLYFDDWGGYLLADRPLWDLGELRCLLDTSPRLPHVAEDGEADIQGRRDALERGADTCRQWIVKEPLRAEHWLALAECEMQLCLFDEAAVSLDRVDELAAGDPKATAVRSELDRRVAIAETVLRPLSADERALQVERLDVGDGRPRWLVSVGVDYASIPTGHMFDDTRLYVCEQVMSGVVRPVQCVALTGHSDSMCGCDVVLAVDDVTGDGVADIVSVLSDVAATRMPSRTSVYVWRDGRLVRVGAADPEGPMPIRDIDGDGARELFGARCIGSHMCHAEQPRWQDIYAYRDGWFRLSNREFPAEFEPYLGELRHKTRDCPDDGEVAEYLGWTLEILGQRRQALTQYRRALPLYEKDKMHWAQDEGFRASYQAKMERTEGRIAALKANR